MKNPRVKADLDKFFGLLRRNGTTPRYRKLARRQKYFYGEQYAHLNFDFDGYPRSAAASSAGIVLQKPDGYVPLRDREPNVRGRLPKRIVNAFTLLLFSEGLAPRVTVEGDENAGEFLDHIVQHSDLMEAMQCARTLGGATGSVAIWVKVEDGKFRFSVRDTKHMVVAEWRDRGGLVPATVVEQYAVEVEELGDGGKWAVRTRWIRRQWDEEWSRLWESQATEKDDEEPIFKLVEEIEHGLGECPIVWIRNESPLSGNGIDGDADYDDQQFGSFDAYDRLSSQMTRGVVANLDPTLVVTTRGKPGEILKGTDNAITLDPGDQANYLEAAMAAMAHGEARLERIKRDIQDATQAVVLDPDKILGSQISGTALKKVMGPMLDRAGGFRRRYGNQGLVRVLNLVLLSARKVEGSQDSKLVLEKDNLIPGTGGTVTLAWPQWISPTPDEGQQMTVTAVTAVSASLVSEETATAYLAPTFGVKDIDAERKRIDKERTAREERETGDLKKDLEAEE